MDTLQDKSVLAAILAGGGMIPRPIAPGHPRHSGDHHRHLDTATIRRVCARGAPPSGRCHGSRARSLLLSASRSKRSIDRERQMEGRP